MLEKVSYQNGAISGLWLPVDSDGLPLLVMIPGGGGSAQIFDLPTGSFLESARVNGFSGLALNRPGQADSAPLAVDHSTDEGVFAANADILLAAIDEIWSSLEDRLPGVVIYGSSIGGAIALHMAARWSNSPRAWPLLGLSLADIGQVAPEQVIDTWHRLPMHEMIDLAEYAHLFFGQVPAWTMEPPPSDADKPQLLVPRAELQEVVGGWLRQWRQIAERVSVPVQYRLAGHDAVWKVDTALVEEFSVALAVLSPYVDARIVSGASHVIGMGTLSKSHFLDVLSFAKRCEVMQRHPQMLAK